MKTEIDITIYEYGDVPRSVNELLNKVPKKYWDNELMFNCSGYGMSYTIQYKREETDNEYEKRIKKEKKEEAKHAMIKQKSKEYRLLISKSLSLSKKYKKNNMFKEMIAEDEKRKQLRKAQRDILKI